MGKNKKPLRVRELEGNPGKRPLPPGREVDVPVRAPYGLSDPEKRYWKMWSEDLIAAGKLTKLTLPSFMTMIKMTIRLDTVNEFLEKENTSLLQEIVHIDGSGQEHRTFRESAYAQMSRHLTVTVHRLQKTWLLTADSTEAIFKPRVEKGKEEFFKE